MNWFRKLFPPRPARPQHGSFLRPAVEQLETRELLTNASAAVAVQIVGSTENFSNFVNSEYQRFLGRAADSGGFNFWLGQLQRGLAPESVEAGFVSSLEYIFDHGNNTTGWILGLYQDLLRRVPSAFEVSLWQNALAAGTTTFQVALAFSTSAERDVAVITQDYVTFLGRPPELAAVVFWTSRLQSGLNRAGLASAIVGSPEFFVRQGGTNTGFIVAAYQTVLNRTPAQSEINFWLGVMAGIP